MTVQTLTTVLPTRHFTTHPIVSIRQMFGVRRQRKALAKLDAALLTDIGVSKADARAEVKRPFWDCPAHWRA